MRALRPWLVLLGATAFFTTDLANIDLWAPDEPRYAAIAEELRTGRHGAGGLLLLHLNDEPYSQKPPLYFWLAAALGLASGRVDELAARLPSAVEFCPVQPAIKPSTLTAAKRDCILRAINCMAWI